MQRPKGCLSGLADLLFLDLGPKWDRTLPHYADVGGLYAQYAFLARIELSPRDGRGEAYFVRLPSTCSFEVVAGARFQL